MTEPVTGSRRPSAARDRVLATADRLFSSTGVQAVGVDRLISEARVARMTFFRHFPSKDDLVVAFLTARAGRARADLRGLRAANPDDPRSVLTAMGGAVAEASEMPGFRGCEFINTAAEYCDPAHPARVVVTEHRAWVKHFIEELLAELGHPEPHAGAELLLMLRTGAMIAASLDSVGDERFVNAWNSVIDAATPVISLSSGKLQSHAGY
jgi:AcrR family transcriptional regulator